MWKNKNVWIILMGEFVAGLGLWLGIIGNLEFMQDKVPSDFLKAVILAIGLLAGLLLGPLAGRITDQVDKKKVMLFSGFGRSVSVLFMFAAIYTGSVLWMVVFMIFIQVSAAFYFPALQAAIPLVVKEKDLLQLNGVHMNVATLSRILGTALAGIFLVVMSLSMLYFLSMIAYLLLFFITFFLKLEEPNAGTIQKGKAKAGSFKEVFPIIKGLPIVMMTLVMTLIPLLFIGGFNLMVINISDLQDSSAIKGWIYTAEGIAFMLGAFFVKQISGKRSPYSILFLFSFVIGAAQMLLFFADQPVISVIAFAIFGFAVGCFFPTAATIFQTRIPKDFHGRFFSFRNMLDRLIFQVVLLMTGLFLDIMGLQYMTLMFGIVSLAATALFYSKYCQLKGTVLAEKAG
ncbi:MFS transporter [Rossellomorea vietnamensis]|uniref:MFS transporter n=1 Tax=Rossellomorea vietnamensis TaxID=218284 RepID=A0A5D4NLA9_9BACI|nr:MFS transporter [Rossellomorea vietnamensis]TYS14670.1 MFS transporter [Rossellomorea vietnamensis]